METKVIDNFSKGLISRLPADKISDNAFSDCCNIDLSDNYLPKSIKGKIKVNDTLLDNKSCMGCAIYNSKVDGSLLIVACGGYLWYSPLNRDDFHKIQINNNGTDEDVLIDENVRVRFAQYNDRLFVFTGKYPVIENEDFNDACILVIYRTKATYLNRDNFYAWLSNNDGNLYYTLSSNPSSGAVIFSDLYRTKIQYTVSSVSGTTLTDSGGVTYTRTETSDCVNNNVPQGLRIGFIHQERLFGLGSIEDDNGVYWSQPYDPVRWTPVYGLNYDTVGKDDGEKITGGASFGGAYIYIFKQHHVYRYLTNGDIDQWTSNKVDTTYGTVAHETIRLFNGFLTYLSLDGVAQLNGNTAVLIDEQIQDKTKNISVATGTQIERSYKKNSNWDNTGATTNGIVTLLPQGIRRITNSVYFSETGVWTQKESVGKFLDVTDTVLNCGIRTDFESTASSSDTKNILSYTSTGSEVIRRGFCFKIEPKIKNWNLQDVQIYITSKSYNNNTKDGYVFLQLRKGSYNGQVVATTANKGYDSISVNAYNSFSFNNVAMEANTTYWVCGNGGASERVSGYGCQFVVKLATYSHNGDGYYADTLQNQSPLLKYNTNIDLADYTYKSAEIDYGATGFTINRLQLAADDTYSGYTIKISVANYPTSVEHWSDIDSAYITEYTITNLSDISLNINNAHRYVRYKIEFTKGFFGLRWFIFWTLGSYSYISEPIKINTVTPQAWGISEFTRIERGFYSGVATVYMRSGADLTDLSNATWYEIANGEQVPNDITLNIYIQFKVTFPELCDNFVNDLKVTYYTSENITKVCAIVYKDKYRLNIPQDKQSSDNAIECVYDKAGYWTIKDNENNFDYCKSNDDLFAISATEGQVYKKETGYKNDESNYISYFVTKKFALSDFENLFRKIKTRYIASQNITVGVSVNDGEYVNYVLTYKDVLTEIIKTLTGIVRGQTIKLKFSWQAENQTEIHDIVLYWQTLRELNRG